MKRTISSIFFALLFASGGLAFAEGPQGCQTIDLSGEEILGSPQNQGMSDWCFAFAARDLITFATGEKVSAIDVAVTYHGLTGRNVSGTGVARQQIQNGGQSVAGAVKLAAAKGVCSERSISASRSDLSDEINRLTEVYTRYRNAAGSTASSCADLNIVQSIFPRIGFDDLMEILRQPSSWQFLTELDRKSCEKERHPVRNLSVMEEDIQKSQGPALRDLNRLLDRGKIAALGYRHGFMTESGRDSLHASTIVGRRFNSKTARCEYKLRDSLLSVCGELKDRFRKDCSTGYLWVTQDELLQNGISLTFIR